jgi:hypothetical protein
MNEERVDRAANGMPSAWRELVGQVVVLDLSSPFVCIGTLGETAAEFVVLTDADVHDLRDTSLTREQYVVKSRQHGQIVNRRRAWISTREIVALARLADVNLD